MLNAVISSLLGGARIPTAPPAPAAPPAPVPTPVDAPATAPSCSGGVLAGSPQASSSAAAPASQPGPEPSAAAAAETPPSVPLSFRPNPSIVPATPDEPGDAAPKSVPLSFRPDPSILSDEDLARARAIETQREIWLQSIVARVGAPAERPTLSADEAEGAEPPKPEAA